MRVAITIVILALATGWAVIAADPHRDVRCLVARGTDALRDRHAGWHCLHYAAARDDRAALARALDHGAAVNARSAAGQTPLNVAAEHGSLDAAQLLIAHNADIEARDGRNGFTALHWAAQAYHPAIARALVAAQANVNAENKWQQTPLWVAAWQADQGNTEIAHVLVAAGADIHRTDHRGNTPLIMAARAGHRPMIGYLLDLGADLSARNDEGRNALIQAVVGAHAEAVRLLLARGADPNTETGGRPPLARALAAGDHAIADLLVANGATGYDRYAADAAIERGRRAYTDQAYDAAIRAFSAAIALRPASPDAFYRRALAFRARRQYEEAGRDLRRALTLAPDNRPAREALARLYVDTGHYGQAIGTLERLLEHEPDNARALYLMAESRDGLGDTRDARSLFQRACALGFQPACRR